LLVELRLELQLKILNGFGELSEAVFYLVLSLLLRSEHLVHFIEVV